jgi:Gluconate 2-dehydrogenase subunit 3
MTDFDAVRATRRTFLAFCAAAAGAVVLPVPLRLRALDAFAATTFAFTPHQRAVLGAAADTVVPGGTVRTRHGSMTVPSAGQAGVATYIENLLSGAMIFAAGVRRPPYVVSDAPVFPAGGALPLWTVKRIAWYGDPVHRPTRPYAWPSELRRLQNLYASGIDALDAAAAPLGFDAAPPPQREAILRALQASEAAQYDGRGEGGQPFFHTFLDHVAQSCFGDPVYGGNPNWVYWRMIGFTGPSFVSFGGPGPGQGWTADDMAGQFQMRS